MLRLLAGCCRRKLSEALLALALALRFARPLRRPTRKRTTESAASRHAVHVREITSPGGIEAWLVSDSTVPMIVMRAYWRGGSAIEPANMPSALPA
jgi:hypothetical protein